MRRAGSWFVGAIALGLPLSVQANAGIGFFLVASPFLVMAFVPAVLVEAPILSRLLRVGLRQGLWWSFLANLYSTVIGTLIGFAADFLLAISTGSSGLTMNRYNAVASLVPMFFVTWWLERRVIRRMQPKGAMQSPGRATLVANAVSYSLLAFALLFVPAHGLDYPREEARWRLSEVMAEMSAARTDVSEYFMHHGRFPEPATIATKGKYLQSLKQETDGRLVAVIHYPGLEDLHGKRVILAPRLDSGNLVAWDCYTPDAAHRYLPANCRQGPPETGRR